MEKPSLWSSLLCSETLSSTVRNNLDANVTQREELKELLSAPAVVTPAICTNAESPARYSTTQHCFEIILQDFLERKSEIQGLNKARKVQIEDILRANDCASIEHAFQAKVDTVQHSSLLVFGYQLASFHLVQLLLLKRWKDLGLIEKLDFTAHTPNWQINNFLKNLGSRLQSQGNHWTFIKQNVYSWFSPSLEALQSIQQCLQNENYASLEGSFPSKALENIYLHAPLSLESSKEVSPSSAGHLLRIMFSTRSFDRGHNPSNFILDGDPKEQFLISGLANGSSLTNLKQYFRNGDMNAVWAFSNCDFEKFLTEALILWTPSKRIASMHLLPRSALKSKGQVDSLFHDKVQLPYSASYSLCMPEKDGSEIADAAIFLSHLKEGALAVLGSNQFWPTDTSLQAQELREHCLRLGNLRMIIDLRQLACDAAHSLPKGIFVFERCSSKEIRDAHRPRIFRAKGQLTGAHTDAFFEELIYLLTKQLSAGELLSHQLKNLPDVIRVDCMAAAANQSQLKSTPWMTLTDPKFYEFSLKLKRFPNKAFLMSTLLRWPTQKDQSLQIPKKAVLLQENSTRLLLAYNPADPESGAQELQNSHLLLPEMSVAESNDFFIAQIYSAPIQFWYRLELEQSEQIRSVKAMERQQEQRLKMLPLVKIFEQGALLPTANLNAAPASADQIKFDLHQLLRGQNLSLADRCKLHEYVCELETTIRKNLQLCKELSAYLYPSLEINRWALPHTMPTPDPKLVMKVFGHLDKTNPKHHPAIHINKLKSSHDFRIQNVQYKDSGQNGLSEMSVFSGLDPYVRLSGPTIYIHYLYGEIQNCLGRNWLEIMNRLALPTDLLLVQTQLKEIGSTIENKLSDAKDSIVLLDQIFLYLFQIISDFTDQSARQTIRHHLNPEETRVSVLFQKNPNYLAKPHMPNFEVPKGLLQ